MWLFFLLKSQDYLGSKVGFTINSNDAHQTIFGGFLSLLLNSLYLYFFIIFSKDMINKTNPVGYDQLKPNTGKYKELNLSENFLVGYQLSDDPGNTYNLSEYFFPIFTYHEWYKTQGQFWTENKTTLDSIQCDKAKNYPEKIIGNFNLSNFICPDLSKVSHKKIYGSFDDEVTKFVSFRLSLFDKEHKKCINITKTQQLFDDKEIYVSSVYPSIDYFISDYIAPFKLKWIDNYNSLSNYNFKVEEMFFQNNELEEDFGFLFEQINNHNHIAVNRYKQTSNPRDTGKVKEVCGNPEVSEIFRLRNYFMSEIF